MDMVYNSIVKEKIILLSDSFQLPSLLHIEKVDLKNNKCFYKNKFLKITIKVSIKSLVHCTINC